MGHGSRCPLARLRRKVISQAVVTLYEMKKCYLLKRSGKCRHATHTNLEGGGSEWQRNILCLNFSCLAVQDEFYFIILCHSHVLVLSSACPLLLPRHCSAKGPTYLLTTLCVMAGRGSLFPGDSWEAQGNFQNRSVIPTSTAKLVRLGVPPTSDSLPGLKPLAL